MQKHSKVLSLFHWHLLWQYMLSASACLTTLGKSKRIVVVYSELPFLRYTYSSTGTWRACVACLNHVVVGIRSLVHNVGSYSRIALTWGCHRVAYIDGLCAVFVALYFRRGGLGRICTCIARGRPTSCWWSSHACACASICNDGAWYAWFRTDYRLCLTCLADGYGNVVANVFVYCHVGVGSSGD